ncbi:hypothetical protein Cob_v000817 [Colletotrichum orbiculare MAFF 240422]|uniref:Uncharacterized protein n=1 Tax=Colletotrichum orbiculare (strain 104-T / ATCC 96160 / CBS 514.97 / LARS 414 / MAFF 240422) TaxID=1213857 RepID=A0A484G9S3_COLOR|nr:hypothetical protein Cob_v000817 [Colletotrichum orbiculare MAFF 240422]
MWLSCITSKLRAPEWDVLQLVDPNSRYVRRRMRSRDYRIVGGANYTPEFGPARILPFYGYCYTVSLVLVASGCRLFLILIDMASIKVYWIQ